MMKCMVLVFFCLNVLFIADLTFANQKIEGLQAKINYSVGFKLAKDLAKQGVEIRPEALVKGVESGLSQNKTLLTEEEMRTALTELQKIYVEKATKLVREKAARDRAEGKAVMKGNSEQSGVVPKESR